MLEGMLIGLVIGIAITFLLSRALLIIMRRFAGGVTRILVAHLLLAVLLVGIQGLGFGWDLALLVYGVPIAAFATLDLMRMPGPPLLLRS